MSAAQTPVDVPLEAALRDLATRTADGPVLVGLDFDGVLAPLVDDPSASRPLPEATDALTRLASLAPRVALALVSGRALADLAALAAAPDGTRLVGGHGAERGVWRAGHLDRVPLHLPDDAAARLAALAADAAALVAGTSGRLETKPASVVVHTRTATPDDAGRLTAAAVALGEAAGADVLHGKDVVELAVLDVDKGSALADLRAEVGAVGLLYAGDDVTDERAFAALGPDDVTVKVGTGPTRARLRVAGPPDVAVLLGRLADLLSADAAGH